VNARDIVNKFMSLNSVTDGNYRQLGDR